MYNSHIRPIASWWIFWNMVYILHKCCILLRKSLQVLFVKFLLISHNVQQVVILPRTTDFGTHVPSSLMVSATNNMQCTLANFYTQTEWIHCRILSSMLHTWFHIFNWLVLSFLSLFWRTEAGLKNGFFWDVTPCGSCKNRRFGGT
jgi:hypothetical protein